MADGVVRVWADQGVFLFDAPHGWPASLPRGELVRVWADESGALCLEAGVGRLEVGYVDQLSGD